MTKNYNCYKDWIVNHVSGLPLAGLHFPLGPVSNWNIGSLRTGKRDGKQLTGSSNLGWEVMHVINNQISSARKGHISTQV